jgi:hypothetical protein
MMIDERSRSAANGGQCTDNAAHLDAFRRMGSIQPPPDELQNLVKVSRSPRRRWHSSSKRGVQMCVAVHEPRHQHRAAAIDDLIPRHADNICTNANDLAIHDAQISGFDPRWVKLHEQSIAEESGH